MLNISVIMYLIIVAGIIGIAMAIGYVVMYFVKLHRVHCWRMAHGGELIEEEYLVNWCQENGVNPSYFI